MYTTVHKAQTRHRHSEINEKLRIITPITPLDTHHCSHSHQP